MARILVMDDQPSVRAVLTAVLRRQGYDVVEASTGRVDLAAIGPVDVALVDVFMPDVDGLDFLVDVHANVPGLAVIAMTGSPFFRGMDVGAVARRLGAHAFVSKPFDYDELVRTVADVLRSAAAAAAASAPAVAR